MPSTDMAGTPKSEAASTTTDVSADDESDEARNTEAQVHVYSEVVTGASPTFVVCPPAAGREEETNVCPEDQEEEDVHSPKGPDEADDLSPGVRIGRLTDGEADPGDMPKLSPPLTPST